MRSFVYRLGMATVVCVWLGSGFAEAGVILSPSAVVANTMGGSPEATIDRAGLPPFTSGVTDYDAYMATNPTGATTAWLSNGATTGHIDYDLGGLFSIEGVTLWNSGRSLQIDSFTIFTSVVSSFTGAVDVGTFSYPSDTFPLDFASFSWTPSVGQFVRLQINSNHGALFATTLREIAFDASPVGPTPVPEPSSLALLSLGLAAATKVRRRRSQVDG